MDSFRVFTVRSNTERRIEDPAKGKTPSLVNLADLFRHSIRTMKSNRCDSVLLRTNGDVSFLRDMMVGITVSSLFRRPLSVHLHASRLGFWSYTSVESLTAQHKGPRKLLHSAGYRLASLLLKKAHSFSQLTEQLDLYYRKLGFRPADLIIPNATRKISIDFSEKRAGSVLFVGRLSREKGFFDLLEALRSVIDVEWELNVLGSASSQEDEGIIAGALNKHPGRDRIHFRGVVAGEEKWEYYRRAAIVVLPSYIEVFPNVLLEAMASGCALLSSDVGEVRSVVHPQGAVLTAPGDVRRLGELLNRTLAGPGRVEEMGRVNLSHSVQYHVEHIAELFAESVKIALDRFSRRS